MTMKNSADGSEKKKEEEKKKPVLACEKWGNVSYLKKRSHGVKKKLHELTTLCGIEGFMIIVPESQSGKGQCSSVDPIIWPENKGEVLRLIERFNSLDNGKRRKCCSSDMGLKEDQKGAQRREKGEEAKKLKICSPQEGDCLDGFSPKQLKELMIEIDSKILAVNVRINLIKAKEKKVLETGEVECSDHQIIPLPLDGSQIFHPCSCCNHSEEDTINRGLTVMKGSNGSSFEMGVGVGVGPLNWPHQGSATLEEMMFNSNNYYSSTNNFDISGSNGINNCFEASVDPSPPFSWIQQSPIVGPFNWLHQGSATHEEMTFNSDYYQSSTNNFNMNGSNGINNSLEEGVDPSCPFNLIQQAPETLEDIVFSWLLDQ